MEQISSDHSQMLGSVFSSDGSCYRFQMSGVRAARRRCTRDWTVAIRMFITLKPTGNFRRDNLSLDVLAACRQRVIALSLRTNLCGSGANITTSYSLSTPIDRPTVGSSTISRDAWPAACFCSDLPVDVDSDHCADCRLCSSQRRQTGCSSRLRLLCAKWSVLQDVWIIQRQPKEVIKHAHQT